MFGGARVRKGSRSAGFTMIELMLGLGVLLVAVLGALGSQLVSHDLVQTTKETDAATTDLQAAMEQLLLRGPDQIPVAGSPFQAGQPIVAFENLRLKDERLVATYPGYTPGGTGALSVAGALTSLSGWHGSSGNENWLHSAIENHGALLSSAQWFTSWPGRCTVGAAAGSVPRVSCQAVMV